MGFSKEEKMARKILVVKADTLYQKKQFEGFCLAEDYNFEKVILENFEYQNRGEMEIDPSFQQTIPYGIIVNQKTHKVIAYQRDGVNSGEQRLHNKRSLGLGGHIEVEEKDAQNPLQATLVKEIREEIGLDSITSFKIIGYLNDNSDEVGKVHFGVLYVVYTNDTEVEIGDGELEKVFFKTPEEIDELMNDPTCDMESRSRIARTAFKQL